MPRAARKPVRLSNRSSAASSASCGVGGERAQLGRGLVGIAGDREESLDQRARLARQPRCRRRAPPARGSGRRSRRPCGRRPLLMPAIDSRSVTSAMRGLGIGAGQRRQHALVFRRPFAARRAPAGRGRGRAWLLRLKSFTSRRFQAGARSSAATSAENSPTSPMRISGVGDAVVRGRLEPEREHLGVGRRLVGAGRRIRCRPAGTRPAAPSRSRKTGPR